MKQILLLTDFSENANNAIEYAMRFFEFETCSFHIMHVHKIGSFTSDDLMYASKENIYDTITKEPKEKLHLLEKHLKEKYNNEKHHFETIVDFDVFIDAVNQAVENKNIDYIVMGTNGITGAKEILLGSNTINVIRKVTCKTLVIPEHYTYKPLDQILLTLDSNNFLNGNAFTELLEFKETYKLDLNVLRVNKNKIHTDVINDDHLNLAIVSHLYNAIEDVPTLHAVSSYLQTHNIALLAIITHKENWLERLFLRSKTIQITSIIHIPLLVFHDTIN